MRVFAILAVLAGSVVGLGGAPAANAYPLCEQVWTDGTILGVHAAGDCYQYGGPTNCTNEGAGAWPQADLYFEACLPAIVAGPTPAG